MSAFSVCLTPDDAELYKLMKNIDCVPMNDAKATKWCQKKYGKEYEAYRTTDKCSKELSFSLRGKEYKETKWDETGTVQAACMTFEQGKKYNCEKYDYKLAENYCADNFGMKYLAFIPGGECTLARAASLRGEVSPKKLLNGLGSRIDELESMVTMIDRQGMDNTLGHLSNKKVAIGAEFYTQTMKRIMAYMNETNELLLKNSQLNVKISKNKYAVKFLRISLRYTNLLARLYKIYAIVAHKNTYVLKSYNFDNLKYLSLKLRKEFALELMAKINFDVRHINDGKDIEFLVSEQEKQNYEYLAISKPETKVDYAKLVTFMGARSTVTNHWGVQRITKKDISQDRVNSCGKGFLSLRPKHGSMSQSNAMKDLWKYDLFVNEYAPLWQQIVRKSWDIPLLSTSVASNLIKNVLNRNVSVKEQIKNTLVLNRLKENQIQGIRAEDALNSEDEELKELLKDISIEDEIARRVEENSSLYKDAEDMAWANFSNFHFTTIILPGDDIYNVDSMLNKMATEAYWRRLQAIKDTFTAMYVYMSDKKISLMENYIASYANKNLKQDFYKRFKDTIRPLFANYNKKTKRDENRRDKVKETLNAIKKNARAFAIEIETSKEKPQLDAMKTMAPQSMNELALVFQTTMTGAMKATLERDKEKAKIVEDFFKSIAERFNKRFLRTKKDGSTHLIGTPAEREKALREIGVEVAAAYHALFPYTVRDITLTKERYIERYATVRRDNTRVVRSPLYRNGTVRPMPKRELMRQFDKEKTRDNLVEMRVQQKDGVSLATPRILTGNYTSRVKSGESNRVKPGYNKDKITTGEILSPMTISEKELKKLRGTYTKRENEQLLSLLENSPFAKNKNAKTQIKKAKEKLGLVIDGYYEDMRIKTNPELIYELLRMLNLHMKTTIGVNKAGGYLDSAHDQRAFAAHYTSQAYQVAPILRADSSWEEKVQRPHISKTGRLRYVESTKIFTKALYEKIIHFAYNKKTGAFSDSEALKHINEAYDKMINNSKGKVETFCKANYLNYKNDDNFRTVFRSSEYLRLTLKSPMASDPHTTDRIKKFDEEVKKEVRTRAEVWKEDYIQPIMKVTGIILVAALLITFCIGTGGTGIPAVIGAVTGWVFTVDSIIFIPLTLASIYVNSQIHFVEVPAQLKFNKSLAYSQIGESGVIDWDMHRQSVKHARKSMFMDIGFMALDVFFMGMAGKQIKTAMGITGVKSYKKLTGMKLRGFGKPTPHMYGHKTFAKYREQYSYAKAVIKTVGNRIDRLRYYLPKFQPVDIKLIRTTALRQGLAKAARTAKVAKAPWKLIDDMTAYTDKLSEKLFKFKAYSKAEKAVIEELGANPLTIKELLEHGLEYTSLGFTWKGFRNAVKEKRVREYIMNFGSLMTDLRKLRGELVQRRIDDIKLAIEKLNDVRNSARGLESAENFNTFLTKLTDEELVALKEVAKRSPRGSLMRNFKDTFKQYDRVVQGLRNTKYMYGSLADENFALRALYRTRLTFEDTLETSKFKNDAEEIVNFYESLISQSHLKDDVFVELRESIEIELSRLFTFDEAGKRIYLNN